MSQQKDRFMIIDGNALLHRAWHALPQTMQSPDGKITNAAYGFSLIFLKAVKEWRPSHLVVCFDPKGPTFRDKLYEDYKAGREKKPAELYEQIGMIKEVLAAFGVLIYQEPGVEADDVIGTLCRLSKSRDWQKVIVTGDLDTLQLVDERTSVYGLKKGVSESLVYNVEEIKKKYDGLLPGQLIDFKALCGDPSDNIPGASGIGEKTAIELLRIFGSVEEIYKQLRALRVEKLSRKVGLREAVFKKLLASSRQVKLSQKLATIKQNVKIKFNFKEAQFGRFNLEEVVRVFRKYAFRSLINQGTGIGEMYDVKPQERLRGRSSRYVLIDDEGKMKEFLSKLQRQKKIAIDVETDGLDVVTARPVGISVGWEKGKAYYLDFNRRRAGSLTADGGSTLLGSRLREILVDEQVKKIGHNLKFDYQVLKNVGIDLRGLYFDTMVAAYLINPGQRVYSLAGLAFQYFGATMQKIEDLIGPKGQQGQLSMKQVEPEKVAYYAAEDVDFTWQLYQKFRQELLARNVDKVFFEIEMPLVPILADMEQTGIKLEVRVLQGLGKKVSRSISKLEATIHRLAGQKFNIASPLQLKEVLFKQLDISTQGLKKTKTGISTAASELEKLRGRHPIVEPIFDYRELIKLKSTYLGALPGQINPATGRIHTSFNQVIATTGRLSSSNPNMQNIPIRTDVGREIRRAFVAERGNLLLSLDYSQIDLRMAAHLSGDRQMIKTFQAGDDIHTATAARLFNKRLSEVTKLERNRAKEANFGVLYGLGPRGLSERMGVSLEEAQDFIDRYQALYPQVFVFLEGVIKETRRTGYAQTMYGRRRYLPEINSGSPVMRAAAERAALNMPVQGTAADIIKMAMIKIISKLRSKRQSLNKFQEIRMLLQVHDELVFEVKKEKVKRLAGVVKKEMESAAKLRVSLKVETKAGRNWGEMSPVVFK